MKVTIELQAYLDRYSPVGDPHFQVDLPNGATVEGLLRHLGIPDDMAQVIIVNNQNVGFEHPLKEGDHVILIPPLAGGGQG